METTTPTLVLDFVRGVTYDTSREELPAEEAAALEPNDDFVIGAGAPSAE